METTLTQFAVGLAISFGMMILTTFVHYEGLSWISKKIDTLKKSQCHRHTLMFIVVFIMLIHCAEIWLYAFAIWGVDALNFGSLLLLPDIPKGEYSIHHVYFAGVVYTSVGFGEIIPTGALRIMSAAAGLNGLLLIAWSASYTYIAMEKLWNRK